MVVGFFLLGIQLRAMKIACCVGGHGLIAKEIGALLIMWASKLLRIKVSP